jgi:hypothetical protein
MGGASFPRIDGWRGALALLAALSAAMVVIFLVVPAPAGAHDHRVPKTVLAEGKQELQTGRKVWEYVWYAPADDGVCAQQNAILTFGFPRHVPTVAAGSKLRVRINKAQKPRSFEIFETNEIGEKTADVSLRLKPVVREARTVAWDAVFRVDRATTDYRLVAEGHWADREDCGPADQFAFWTFRLRTGSAS